jgi:hypothetical protein
MVSLLGIGSTRAAEPAVVSWCGQIRGVNSGNVNAFKGILWRAKSGRNTAAAGPGPVCAMPRRGPGMHHRRPHSKRLAGGAASARATLFRKARTA